MFSSILVGVDGTPRGRDAIAFATRLAEPAGQVMLAHVHGGHGLRAVGGHGGGLDRDGSQQLLRDERSAADLDVGVELVSYEGSSPGAGLHRLAEERGADVIVVGSSSRGILGRATLGDDTRGALNGAPCAVAIAARAYEQHPFPLAKVGVAYNGSPESDNALQAALELAAPTNADVIALDVVGPSSAGLAGLAPSAYDQTVRLLVAEGKERMGQLRGAQGRAVFGVPGEELATFSAEVDVLVVGSRSYGPLKRLMLGSTSDYLERHARCSLLVLPRAHDAAATA
jgi:nucleotide-binding universal stress UspA family protein